MPQNAAPVPGAACLCRLACPPQAQAAARGRSSRPIPASTAVVAVSLPTSSAASLHPTGARCYAPAAPAPAGAAPSPPHMGARSATEARAFFIARLRRSLSMVSAREMARHRLRRIPFIGVPRAAIRDRPPQHATPGGAALATHGPWWHGWWGGIGGGGGDVMVLMVHKMVCGEPKRASPIWPRLGNIWPHLR